MRHHLLAVGFAAALAVPAVAQETETEAPSLLEQGARMFLEGLLQEMEPALNDLQGMADDLEPAFRDFTQRMGPAFADLLGQVDDISNYHLPEILPNGDIIIRRKTPDEIEQDQDGEIEI